MALFMDGPPASVEDLTDQDSGLLDVCRDGQINASTKLRIGQEEIAGELQAIFGRQKSCWYAVGQDRLTLRNLAISPSLKRWHTFHTLAGIYRDVSFSQLNDRYQAKWKEFEKLAKAARMQFEELGAMLVLDPLPRPQGPSLTPTPATEAGGAYYFAVTTLNAAGEESAPSVAQAFTIPDGNAVDVQPSFEAGNALGWNLYAGASPDAMYQQNGAALDVADDFVFFPSALVAAGALAGLGQEPNVTRALPRLLQRG